MKIHKITAILSGEAIGPAGGRRAGKVWLAVLKIGTGSLIFVYLGAKRQGQGKPLVSLFSTVYIILLT